MLCLAVAAAGCTTPGPTSATPTSGSPSTGPDAPTAASPTGGVSPAVSGTAAATLGISPSTQDYGTVSPGGTSGFIQFTVTNNGGAPSGALATSLAGANAAEFTNPG